MGNVFFLRFAFTKVKERSKWQKCAGKSLHASQSPLLIRSRLRLTTAEENATLHMLTVMFIANITKINNFCGILKF